MFTDNNISCKKVEDKCIAFDFCDWCQCHPRKLNVTSTRPKKVPTGSQSLGQVGNNPILITLF